ncbi:unnamed protein product [Orchesella dallaii]|uniref:Uncharacterized protein n=1 Tax=Orchesella dallaii TaxID=48710 RepID=A0ABP1RIH9_9HEXA
MAKRCIVLLALLLCTTYSTSNHWVTVVDPCKDAYNCESCVLIRTTRFRGDGNCLWKVTSSGESCVATYTPSQEILNVAFNQTGCSKIPSTTTTTTTPSTKTIKSPSTSSIEPCRAQTQCESCVSTSNQLSKNGSQNCVWIVTYYASFCVPEYLPILPLAGSADNLYACRRISSAPTRAPVFTLPIRSCHTRTTCQSCVNTKLTTATHNCFWEVSSVGQGCVEKFTTPIEGLFNIAYNEAGCTSIFITTRPRIPTKQRDPCLDEITCETCVRRATSPGLRILSTCLWVETPSNGNYCASSFSPWQKIDKIAFTLNGCATSLPHPTCEQQVTCEACVATRLEGDKNETCVWEVKTTGQRCAPDYTRSQEIINVVFSKSSCSRPAIQPTNEIIRTTLVIPEIKCDCCDSSTYNSPAAIGYINEIDGDGHDHGSARGPTPGKHPRRQGRRQFNGMQKRQRKLAGETDSEIPRLLGENEGVLSDQRISPPLVSSDPCLVGINCESCVRTPNGGNRQGSCAWEVTSGGSLCVANYTPSQEIKNVFFNEEECKKLSN